MIDREGSPKLRSPRLWWCAVAAMALASCTAPTGPATATQATVSDGVGPTPTASPTPPATSKPTVALTPTPTFIPRAPLSPNLTPTPTPSPTFIPRMSPTPTASPTPTPLPTPTPTPPPPTPTPTPDLYSTLAFEGFTHLPVDFAQALDAFVECSVYAGLTPFVYYFHVNHTEGPKKWYIGTCRGEVVKVYLPARALLYRWGIREDGSPGTFNGDKVIINADVRFEVGSDVTVGFGHLALLDEIRATAEDSPNSEVIFEAGTHIGYMYTPDQDFESLDFCCFGSECG